MLIVCFASPDPTQDYSFSVVDARTGNSFSPSKNAFLPAPADELTPMLRDLSPNRPALRYGVVPADVVPPTPGQYLAFFHPAAGGPPVGDPAPLVRTPPASRSLNFALSF